MNPTRRGLLGVTTASALLLGACSADKDGSVRTTTTDPSSTSTTRTPPTASAPSTTTSTTGNDPVSLTDLRYPAAGGQPEILRTDLANDAYTRYDVRYASDDLSITGVLLRPAGAGPFPGIVLDHGHVDPAAYATGDSLTREQDALAQAGFVVLHTDYRGLAGSDPADELDQDTGLGNVRDAVNALAALKQLPYVDTDRLAMLGVSMGGGVVMGSLVTQPGLFGAAVLYDSISSDFVENAEHFAPDTGSGVIRALSTQFGTPQANPSFYQGLSPRTYFDQITAPVLMHHGTADGTCPLSWSQETQQLMQAASVDCTLRLWQGEHHIYEAKWQDAMDVSLDFLRDRLGL